MRSARPVLSFECSRCEDSIFEEDVDLPGFDYSTEVHSDGRGTAEQYVACPTCKKEYTVEISNMFDQYEAEIPEEPGISVDISVPYVPDDDESDYLEYLKSYVPAEPAARYQHSLELLDEMVAAAGALKSFPVFHRMLLLQHVAMMEAYFCDRLITLAGVDQVRLDLITNLPALKDQKHPLVAIARKPDLVSERVTMFLKCQLYHELDAVEKMYVAGLGSSPFVDDASKKFLETVMINRHHCVHREGRDNDGKVLREIDEAYVTEVRKAISALVEHIEQEFSAQIAKVDDDIPI